MYSLIAIIPRATITQRSSTHESTIRGHIDLLKIFVFDLIVCIKPFIKQLPRKYKYELTMNSIPLALGLK